MLDEPRTPCTVVAVKVLIRKVQRNAPAATANDSSQPARACVNVHAPDESIRLHNCRL